MEMLVEKWRPSKREDLVGNKAELDKLFSMVNSGKLIHCILDGTPGSGKTSSVLAIAKQLFGTYLKSNFIEMNASDSRSIDDVRTTIKTFAKINPFGSTFKVILLDEAEQMTLDAQNALRRIMEKYSDITVFFLCTNQIEKIIEPIRSRCEVFHFGPISKEDICARLQVIYLREKNLTGVVGPDVGLALLKVAEYSQGDMRKALNHLQVLLNSGEPLSETSVDTIKPIDYGKLVVDALQAGRFLEARTHVLKALELGYDARHLLSLCHKVYIASDIDIEIMKKVIISLSECDYRMTQGVDKILALDALLLRLLK